MKRIVLTGGPCGGKTSALSMIEERLTSLGYRVFLVPEVATLMLTHGVRFSGLSRAQCVFIERCFLHVQFDLEASLTDIALQCGEKSVLICDRGTMDVKGYLEPHEWEHMIGVFDYRFPHDDVTLRDERYDAVIHMRTVAVSGAGYTKVNNPARQESADEAVEADKRTLDAWLGHPCLRVIENEASFGDKVRKAVQAVCQILGVPEPVERERKFLVRWDGSMPVKSVTVEIEQTYLQGADNGVEERVRRRGTGDSWVYTHTIKQGSGEHRVERERRISKREYADMLLRADPKRVPVQKLRTCFVWSSQYFELDTFVEPRKGLCVLEAELPTDEDLYDGLDIPPWLDVIEEVTDNPQYANAQLARVV